MVVGGTLKSNGYAPFISFTASGTLALLGGIFEALDLSFKFEAIPLALLLTVLETSNLLTSTYTEHEFDPMLSLPAEPFPE